MIKIHPLSDIQSPHIGDDTQIWQFSVVLKNAVIGSNCNINCNCFIENDVIIGNNVTIKSGVQIWDGIIIGDNVFIGPNATFTNDLLPRSKSKNWELVKTVVEKGTSIGANATIIAGVTIGRFALVGAGSVVTQSIPPYSVWYGNPAKIKGYITENATLLDLNLIDKRNNDQYVFDNQKDQPFKKNNSHK